MLTISDVKNLCEREPNFDDMVCSLRAISKQPKKMWKETTITSRETLRIMLETHDYNPL